jgi:hypothetical protein
VTPQPNREHSTRAGLSKGAFGECTGNRDSRVALKYWSRIGNGRGSATESERCKVLLKALLIDQLREVEPNRLLTDTTHQIKKFVGIHNPIFCTPLLPGMFNEELRAPVHDLSQIHCHYSISHQYPQYFHPRRAQLSCHCDHSIPSRPSRRQAYSTDLPHHYRRTCVLVPTKAHCLHFFPTSQLQYARLQTGPLRCRIHHPLTSHGK